MAISTDTARGLYHKAHNTGDSADVLALMQAICRIDTGSVLCDSGSFYGYAYNAPARSKPVDAENLTISTAHHLAENCRVDDRAAELNARFDKLARRDADSSWFELRNDFLTSLHDAGEISFDGYLCSPSPVNTYNGECDLDQTLEFVVFESGGAEYVAVMIHTGCDVRSGYTRPWFFALVDVEYFYDVRLRCKVITPAEPGGYDDYQEISACELDASGEYSADADAWTYERKEVALSCPAQGF